MSPTGNKIAKLTENSLEVLVREGDQLNMSHAFALEGLQAKSNFWWIDDDRLLSLKDNEFSVNFSFVMLPSTD